ncbi:MAG: hypothetical protein LH475_06400 [Cryobacterium sp.]|uniref:hypothetical protein n=1 Tax=unclassified Cryobacterium TaxID=2649013 RepID=UPI0018CBA9D0|nr:MULTISPECIES: hypothetical protein [unclassified Cryobacterium]MCY7404239.1 hypothetical protein [Cryobacterium sp.]MEC5155062.1 hypothetical protein [Cryobacterium sp. CAN_C3]
MDDNVAWVFQKKDVDQPRMCAECGEAMEVTWHGTGYDYGCANFACTQLYFGPPYSEAELASTVPPEVRSPNCPRCLIPMQIVPDGEAWQFSCQQDGCDGIWPPTGP